MKSITKKISLLLLLSVTLFLTSCLDSDGESYIGNQEFSYITQTQLGRSYARTAAGKLITSDRINLLAPGTVALLTYQIDENTETIKVDEYTSIYKVVLGAEPVILDQEALKLTSALEEEEGEEPFYFESVIAPPTWLTMSSEFFGDRWPFSFQYKAKKGEEVKISFYKVPDDEVPANINADILIDIRLTSTSTPEASAPEELRNDAMIANLSALRHLSQDIDNDEPRQLRVKFRFHRSDNIGRLHISDTPIMLTVK